MSTTSAAEGSRAPARVALVTGGSRGIGYAVADALVRDGAAVAITGRTGAHLEDAARRLGGRVLPVQADVQRPEEASSAVERTVERFGRLDVLVNNAGVGLFSSVTDMSVDAWRTTLDTNLSGVFYCCRAAIPHLRRHGGWIINISSLASTNPFAGGAAYCASKAGLNAFSEALMQDVRHEQIRVSCILPGSVATGFSGRGASGTADWKIQPSDVAAIVLDLLRTPERTLPSRVEVRPSRPAGR